MLIKDKKRCSQRKLEKNVDYKFVFAVESLVFIVCFSFHARTCSPFIS